ncbi:MAG: hypothetical protein CO035_05055 [Candidatus Omnitrophica bacterium CG_4_9_14_0_2_um_filter_42_8]|nr:MAG: hypothetical protein CO035_05055 [Candidatus Omnitrophica bacterium CG_4_9_14_0_2_um_filter_42_8]
MKENKGFNVSNMVEIKQLFADRKVMQMLSSKNISRESLEEMYYKRKNTLQQIATEFDTCIFSVARLMDQYGLKRRNSSEATYNRFNKEECFDIKGNLNSKEKLLKKTALTLYWCEGTGDRRGDKKNTTLAFTNKDANMLRIWLKFLFEICGLRRDKVRIRIYLHNNQDGIRLKKYWSEILDIPPFQFENISYTDKISTKEDYNGTVKIKVHNLKLYLIVKNWIGDLKKQLLEECQSG